MIEFLDGGRAQKSVTCQLNHCKVHNTLGEVSLMKYFGFMLDYRSEFWLI